MALLMENARLFGMSRGVLVLVLGLVLLGFVSGINHGDKVSVIIATKDAEQYGTFSAKSSFGDLKIKHKYSNFDGFASEVDASELGELRKRFVDAVFVDDRKYSVSLDFSVPQIGANDSWNLKDNGVNLNGSGQTVCIIDTGVNYSHPALGGCYGNNSANSSCKVIGGYDYVNGDDDPLDDNGHGTHVSGIVASGDSNYSGVSPGAKIIMIKAMDETGHGDGDDILAGIDWCISNASKFNISVISMSLGDNSTYDYYCDTEAGLWDDAINSAVAAGIAVVVSSGNCDEIGQTSCTSGVSFPACIKNATRVGAVNDSDSIFYMRGSLFELMAPGVGIFSSLIAGGFGPMSGTSMSAPHVSGAIALIKQYLNLSGQSKSVDEIEDVLNDSGVWIDDSSGSGYNFSRIDVYEALLSLDNSVPNVTLVSPANDHVNISGNQSFVCNASDWQLANVTFRIWNSADIYFNETINFSGIENESSFDLVGMPNGDYSWNCFVYDSVGNLGSASSNFSLTIGGVGVNLNSPLNESSSNINLTFFNCSSWSVATYELVNVSFYLWNSSGVLLFNDSKNISGFENVSVFNWTFGYEDYYSWSCAAVNNDSKKGAGTNFSVSYDVTAPNLSGLNVVTTANSAVVSWTTDDVANSSIWVAAGSWSNSSGYTTNHSISISGLSASTNYSYVAWSCDSVGNCDNVSGNFVTDIATVSHHSGGGSSSSVINTPIIDEENSSIIYRVSEEEFLTGYSSELKKNDSLSFRIGGSDDGWHSLVIKNISRDYVEIVIHSNPIELNLSIGESRKLNLTSPVYYDLYIELENISDGVATLNIQNIYEEIFSAGVKDERSAEVENEHSSEVENEYPWTLWLAEFIAVLSFFVLVFLVFKRKKVKKEEADKGKKLKPKGAKN